MHGPETQDRRSRLHRFDRLTVRHGVTPSLDSHAKPFTQTVASSGSGKQALGGVR